MDAKILLERKGTCPVQSSSTGVVDYYCLMDNVILLRDRELTPSKKSNTKVVDKLSLLVERFIQAVKEERTQK